MAATGLGPTITYLVHEHSTIEPRYLFNFAKLLSVLLQSGCELDPIATD